VVAVNLRQASRIERRERAAALPRLLDNSAVEQLTAS
jgi:hypothetical protein